MRSNMSTPHQLFNNVFQLLFVLIYLLLVINVNSINGNKCELHEFQCHSGDQKCISNKLVCNGNDDCSDQSDEKDCDECFAPDWYNCKQRDVCISSSFLCDEVENCPDGDDELNCPGTKHTKRTCGKYEYTCQDKNCIPLDMVCDGRKDCPDGSDEDIGCVHAAEQCKGFFCNNKKCLESHLWVCDGEDDCGDQSDEHGCTYDCVPEKGKFLCKDNDTCITLNQMCDGKLDCADKSDEGGSCNKNNCQTLSCPQGSKCYNFPQNGATCVCTAGYYFDHIKNKCIDVDECETFGICSQICTNTDGGYQCSCMKKYSLKNDNKTCVIESGEPLLLYASHKSVNAVHLRTKHAYKIADNMTQVVGVAYDGQYVYWTNIHHELESIVRASEDGSRQEVVLASGLEAPEDLAIDWLTGNIYFTDNILKHISVCSNDGFNCKILVTINVDNPRGIALHSGKGIMFWTDWGAKPMIGTSLMDGENVKTIVEKDIHWPNCIAIDYTTDRIYWVDAKLMTIESVRLDGGDRRTILKDILKHPYGIAVFEDKIYWSDWETYSIHSCNKVTGKNHEVVIKDDIIYAVHIYNTANKPKVSHPCSANKCSHLCLLSGNSSSCACPENMIFRDDMRTCIDAAKKQKLYVAAGSYLIEMEHSTFGRHKLLRGFPLKMIINNMEYNEINGSIFIADNIRKIIYEFNPITKLITELVTTNIGNVTAMSFDKFAQNLYWTDSERHTIEVLSLRNQHRAIVHFFIGTDKPIGLAVIPDKGKMFVALHSINYTHIDTFDLDGRGSQHHTFETDFSNGKIELKTDFVSQRIYWLDTNRGTIEYASYETYDRIILKSQLQLPFSLAIVDNDVLWSSVNTQSIRWSNKNFGNVKKFDIENLKLYSGSVMMSLVVSKPLSVNNDHKCLHNNGGCSHICITTGKFSSSCLCPTGMLFKNRKNLTCIESLDCEFRCDSGECLTASRKCNGNKDCADGSDENNCSSAIVNKVTCRYDQFACHDGTQCLQNTFRCDHEVDCHDKSDEIGCEDIDYKTKCRNKQFGCTNGRCIDLTAVCDGFDDCGDKSDERDCMNSDEKNVKTCLKDMFQCSSGSCIPKAWECDGEVECIDGSDEHEKCVLKKCPNGMAQCRGGQCIDSTLVCDGHDDCGDNSDETNCKNNQREIVCGNELDSFGDPKHFQCSSNISICLDISAKCNKTAECPRGEDEIGCGGCGIFEFTCENGKCIRKEFHCDGEKDCSDGSDEIDCSNYNSTMKNDHVTNCHENMFDCKDGTCIDYTRVCNGKNDCEKGTDESGYCKRACATDSCEHICTPTPYGAICSCRNGYRLNGDKKTCSDINECTEGHPCSQICENNVGSYRCSCYPQYLLRTDKSSCKSIDNDHYLLFTTHDQARILTDKPISLKVLWSANDSQITGVDVDIKDNKAYFVIQDSANIYEYNLKSHDLKILPDFGFKTKLAIDWITKNLYVVRKGNSDSIGLCNFEKKKCARIIKFRSKESVKALAIDPINNYLFYSVILASTFGDSKTIIYRSGLDGSKPQVLLRDTMHVTSLEAEPNKMELYFIDAHSKTLQSIKYNVAGAKPTIVLKKINAIKNPSGISIYENVAFISNIGAREAVRCQLYGEKNCLAFNLNVFNVEDIVVVGQSRQMESINGCANNECSVLCVQANLGPKCICYDGQHVPPKIECPKPVEYENNETILEKSDEHHATSASSNSAILGICLTIMGIILFGLCGYIIYRRRTADNGNFLINMHFQNPLQQQQNEPQYIDSPSVTTHIQQIPNPAGSKQKFNMPKTIQKFLSSNKASYLTMETGKTNATSKLVTYGQSTNAMDDSDPECIRDSIGNFNDDARTTLIP